LRGACDEAIAMFCKIMRLKRLFLIADTLNVPVKDLIKIKLPSPSELKSTLIDTDKPNELVDKLNKHINSKEGSYPLMLLIGNSGSEKSTF